jgi:hypothetical protein
LREVHFSWYPEDNVTKAFQISFNLVKIYLSEREKNHILYFLLCQSKS